MAVEQTTTTTTVRVTNIPRSATAQDLLTFLETHTGNSTIFACEISSDHKNWKSRGFGRVQFETLESKSKAISLSKKSALCFKGFNLSLSHSLDDVIIRPVCPQNRVEHGFLRSGLLVDRDCMSVLESWSGVKSWVLPERKSVEFWVSCCGEVYRLELQFSDVLEAFSCCVEAQEPNAVLLKLKHAPKLYQRVSGQNVSPRFSSDRYHICKDDVEFTWVRTTDFSSKRSIGQSCTLCLQFEDPHSALESFTSLPSYMKELITLTVEDGEEFHSSSDIVPLVKSQPESNLPYEILFQLNSLVQTQKLSLVSVNNELIEFIINQDQDSVMTVFKRMHKTHTTCYDPVTYIKDKLNTMSQTVKNPSSVRSKSTGQNKIMSIHRVYITPTKIYCLGPELEASNYIVKHYSEYSSDFLRVTFVDEDWGKLQPNVISVSLQQGIFSKPLKTKVYDRALDIMTNGICIGTKKFEFLAFSASQLRSNSVWMFASNEHVTAESIRKWMGCFTSIRSVSKCAARMGQLFSTSKQTIEVPPHHVEIIPDIEVKTDGVDYCFSDGIGKISLSFAKEVASKYGLKHIPSAFQIRYGGYKGVIAVDRNSFKKLSLRKSMCKFDSKNRMLNVTKYSESQSCYFNREIVTLLSTLGVKDDAFLALQDAQLRVINAMLYSTEDALMVLDGLGSYDVKDILVKMLLQGYKPNREPYLSMMLLSHHDNLLVDLRTRCRVFVPKGRILVGCLDESGVLDYGQVYVRITLTKTELKNREQKYFKNMDDVTSVVMGKVVVTRNPCLHPGDVRVLDAVYEIALDEKDYKDCIVFPQKGERPHPNECSGGDLDGDLYFVSWDESLIPPRTVDPMDYTGRRPRLLDHDVTLEEIGKFFVDYMTSDTLGGISNAHLVHADREPEKALSPKCLQLAALHSMAVDFAKSGAPAEMPRALRPREYPDFMARWDRPMYISQGPLGKLYRATKESELIDNAASAYTTQAIQDSYDQDLLVDGFVDFIETALTHKEMYLDALTSLMNYYEAETEDEILTGNIRNKSSYLQRDNRRYGETKDRILLAIKCLHRDAKGWFEGSCEEEDYHKLASAWYHVTYHVDYCKGSVKCLGFPWIVGHILLDIKSINRRNMFE
ncbi:putative RNA-directed RNA polymerase [Helianthus annuus]|uniref:RNA-dependent RNA polymerase n=1 Tax=Helianthus annuus TaxID=4232 RepID=A0A251RWP5_HELAN|nr:RNA-dependent RNA polymerase 2 [Helianthus annuus]KAF5758560.1 putative RNA-directed RNA polymerase [Helianthus annuus]KAJ0436882.1 putative RNA-directed RNA polymerase [Helianthus annuus]KAJ0459194.1 putative RNA-directed RNA polymerase [Helianthus annuus]KAJ0639750.1 putative RNA-directed RNA polymerase [Helianthus annuus]